MAAFSILTREVVDTMSTACGVSPLPSQAMPGCGAIAANVINARTHVSF
jgi:hypothetical protein